MTTTRELRTPRMVMCTPEAEIRMKDTDRGPAWAVGKPGKFKAITGPVEITAENLELMAESYDPEIDRAPINYDHFASGPALGWVGSLFVDEGILWAVPTELSEESAEEIKSGRYRRVSMEISREHQVTGGWYLDGLALLGAQKPAIRGLPEISLAGEDSLVIQLSEAETAAASRVDPPQGPAGERHEKDPRSEEQRAVDRRMGISDERAIELASRRASRDAAAAPGDPEAAELDEMIRLAERIGDEDLLRDVGRERLALFQERKALQREREKGTRLSALQAAQEAGVEHARTFEQRRDDLARGISDERFLVLLSRGRYRYNADLTSEKPGVPWFEDPRSSENPVALSEGQRAVNRRFGISEERARQLATRFNLR